MRVTRARTTRASSLGLSGLRQQVTATATTTSAESATEALLPAELTGTRKPKRRAAAATQATQNTAPHGPLGALPLCRLLALRELGDVNHRLGPPSAMPLVRPVPSEAAQQTRETSLFPPFGSHLAALARMPGRALRKLHYLYEAPMTHTAYSCDCALYHTQGRGMPLSCLAAGGQKGHVSLFWDRPSVSKEYGPIDPTKRAKNKEDLPRHYPEVVLNAHTRWISSCCLTRSEQPYLLTAADDALLKLWDIQSLYEAARFRGAPAENPPVITHDPLCSVCRHTAGIYGLAYSQELGVLTSGKDARVNHWVLGAASLEFLRGYNGTHEGVIKDVAWQPTGHGVFATCGNDRSICVSDLRAMESVSITIPASHDNAVNTVCWAPTDPHVVLTSSFDKTVKYHDTRFPSRPLVTLQRHSDSKDARDSMISRPVHLFRGAALAVPSNTSVTVYDAYAALQGQQVVVHRQAIPSPLLLLPLHGASLRPQADLLAVGRSAAMTFSLDFEWSNGPPPNQGADARATSGRAHVSQVESIWL